MNQNGVMSLFREIIPSYKDNIVLLLGACALMLWVPFLVIGIPVGVLAFLACLITHEKMPWMLIPLTIVAMVLFAIGYNLFRVGWTRILLGVVDGKRVGFNDMREALPMFMNFVLCCSLIGLATGVGAIFLVVPGVFIAVRTAFAPFLVVDEGLGPIEACIKSHEMMTGNAKQVLIWFLLYFVGNLVASNIPLLSLAATPAVTAYFDLVLTKLYRDVSDQVG